jgi:hypothetical protein
VNATATNKPCTQTRNATEARFDDAAARGDHEALDMRNGTNMRRVAMLEQLAHAYWNQALGIEFRLAGSIARALKHEQAATRNLGAARRLATKPAEPLTFAALTVDVG